MRSPERVWTGARLISVRRWPDGECPGRAAYVACKGFSRRPRLRDRFLCWLVGHRVPDAIPWDGLPSWWPDWLHRVYLIVGAQDCWRCGRHFGHSSR
jgi:hypothetical protein